MLRALIESQQTLSRRLDAWLPTKYTVDGNAHYRQSVVPKFLKSGINIVDVGGGKQPYLSPDAKRELDARVTGLDIDGSELSRAPEGCYDAIAQADITFYRGEGDADVVICQAVLEHVVDTKAAIRSIESLLKPGGVAVVFVPNGNAWFAYLNRLIPERLKRWLLGTIFPHMGRYQGFPAYYDRCTPRHLRRLASDRGLEEVDFECYYASAYFSCFFPLYAVWRLWTLVASKVFKEHAAETFCIALRKQDDESPLGLAA